MSELSSAPGVKQFALLRDRRFMPLFLTQFGGAFNDNFYKSALLLLFTYGGIERWGLEVNVINNLVAGTMIIPFLFFAPLAGQYADKYEKAYFIRAIKLAEVAIMVLAALALWLNSAALLLLVLFLTGTQSACFSPLKYAILPQHLHQKELVGANGLLHTGTSLAIFLGLIAGSLAMALDQGRWYVAVGALLVAGAGWYASRAVPRAEPADPNTSLKHNPFAQIFRTLGYARENSMVFWSIIGASWYWFLGSVYLTQLPNFTRTSLFGAPEAVSLLLALFLLGICAGALLCERISRRQVEPGVSLLGALIVTLAGLDLAFAGQAFAAYHNPADPERLYALGELLSMPRWWRVAADVVLLGGAGALYMVPLAALIQSRSRSENRAQIIGASNVINALFMIAAAVVGLVGLGVLGLSIPQLFIVVMVFHLFLCLLLYWRMPEFRQRFLARFWPGPRGD